MNITDLQSFIEKLGPITFDSPFDSHTLVFRIGGKIFLLTDLREWEIGTQRINIKATPQNVQLLLADYDFVYPGYHMNKKHWITVNVSNSRYDNLIFEWIINSFNLVYKSLDKKTVKSLENNE